jgi:hypothetical protein
MATWSAFTGLGDGRHLGCGPSRRFSRAAVEDGPKGWSCSSGRDLLGNPILPDELRVSWEGPNIRAVALRLVFPETGSIGERQEVSGPASGWGKSTLACGCRGGAFAGRFGGRQTPEPAGPSWRRRSRRRYPSSGGLPPCRQGLERSGLCSWMCTTEEVDERHVALALEPQGES